MAMGDKNSLVFFHLYFFWHLTFKPYKKTSTNSIYKKKPVFTPIHLFEHFLSRFKGKLCHSSLSKIIMLMLAHKKIAQI